jgi:transcriptional regulator with AAA-type ATPase domain/ligand-binding sensor domain-containing protein
MSKNTDNPFHRAVWRTYTPADGLAGLHIEQIAQDRDGYLWFTSPHSGASRFDGEAFCNFTHEDRVVCTFCDSQGRVWLALDYVNWYDGQTFHPLEGVPESGYILSIFEDRVGRIWFCGPNLLCYFDGDRVHDLTLEYRRQCERSPGLCWGLAQDRQGNIWIGTDRLVRFDGRRFFVFDPVEGKEWAYVVCQDAKGDIWAGGNDQIWRFDGEVFQPQDLPYRGRTKRVRCDREGRLWFCTGDVGAYCLDGEEFYHITAADGLASNRIDDLLQDREGLLWFATFGAGISRCDLHSMHCFGREDMLRVSKVVEDNRGGLWLGLEDGLARLEGSCLALSENAAEAEGGGHGLLCKGAGEELWVKGERGVGRLVGGDLERPEWISELADVAATAAVVDSQGRLLLGLLRFLENGVELELVLYDGRDCRTLYTREEGSSELRIKQILIARDGRIWFAVGSWEGLAGGGYIGYLNGVDKVVTYQNEEGLVDSRVEDLLEDRQGRLWVATRGGLSCFDERQDIGRQFRNFTLREGLPVNAVLCLCKDRQGGIWCGAEGGVVYYDGSRFQFIRSPALIGPVRSIVEDQQGDLWFATGRGMVRYRQAETRPLVHMLRVVADHTYEGDVVEVPDRTGQVTFEFRGVSMRTEPRDLLYTHRLRGFQEEWQPATGASRVTFPELPLGDYTFEVKGIDRDLNESEPASVDLKVVPDERIQGLAEALGAGISEFVGESPALRRVQAQIAQVAETDLTVLILGETGTGKGLVARFLHAMSTRRDGPLIQINCGALPEALVESELFGHEKGAFTGAHTRKLGKVELATGGTLFLDEIGDMNREAQVKLLHLLEERQFERVGGTQTLQADVRIVAATNRDLKSMVAKNSFREDLFYRLQVFPVPLPPLRLRLEDVELLAVHFAERMATHLHKPLVYIEDAAFAALRSYAWPGNVRELEHVVQRAVIICRDGRLRADDLALVSRSTQAVELQEWVSPEEYERRYMLRMLERCGWVLRGEKGAAAQLGLAESTLRGRMKKLGIERP